MRKASLCLLLQCVLLVSVSVCNAKAYKRPNRTPNKLKLSQHSKKSQKPTYGDRMPWEGRQETYDWEFKKAEFFTKIRETWDNNYVGTLEEAMEKPLCGTLNASMPTTFYGKWHSDDEGHYWWEPASCRLRRLSAQEARQCLSGRHIFMAGDSLTRYQYLSFVGFLSKGVYMAPWAHSDVRSLAVEREWDGWDDFFKSGSILLAAEAKNATAYEECDCTHGAYGGFSDVPSKEHRVFSLTDFPLIDGSQGKELFVTNKLLYNNPSHIQAGIEALVHGLLKLPETVSVPDLAILNMGIWVRDWTATGTDYQGRFETVMEHGNYFTAKNLKKSKHTRLFWKTTTNTVGDVIEEESWNAVNEASLRAFESVPHWQLYDIRALSRQSLEQHLNLYSFDAVHFAPQMYQEFNDFLFNLICSPELEFQTDNLPPGSPEESET